MLAKHVVAMLKLPVSKVSAPHVRIILHITIAFDLKTPERQADIIARTGGEMSTWSGRCDLYFMRSVGFGTAVLTCSVRRPADRSFPLASWPAPS